MAKGGAVKALATCFAQSELISSNLVSAIGTQTHPPKLEVFVEEWNSFNERAEVPTMVP